MIWLYHIILYHMKICKKSFYPIILYCSLLCLILLDCILLCFIVFCFNLCKYIYIHTTIHKYCLWAKSDPDFYSIQQQHHQPYFQSCLLCTTVDSIVLLLYSYIGIRISITIIVCVVIIIASIVVMIMIIISVVIHYHGDDDDPHCHHYQHYDDSSYHWYVVKHTHMWPQDHLHSFGDIASLLGQYPSLKLRRRMAKNEVFFKSMLSANQASSRAASQHRPANFATVMLMNSVLVKRVLTFLQ